MVRILDYNSRGSWFKTTPLVFKEIVKSLEFKPRHVKKDSSTAQTDSGAMFSELEGSWFEFDQCTLLGFGSNVITRFLVTLGLN